ncbi:Asp-tRNA(Asn)/Glu-tRNA(Gln) amidotransferase subunit GatC [Isachenkonia alkalipeptolytica]|nr:Asp-tRNA(Asn)/Glu-tRNA(Gln) amidotransferase subunit GatC [Isachenkonia alkalipeptolytica]
MERFERKELNRLCRQSRLRLKNKEIRKLQEDLQELSGYLTKLEGIEVTNTYEAIEEGYWMHKNKTPLRKDRVEEFDQKELMRKNFPKRNHNFVTVPKVIK